MKTIATVIGACLIGTCGGYFSPGNTGIQLASLQGGVEMPAIPDSAAQEASSSLSGDYLCSIFAQRHHDWKKAGEYLDTVMRQTPDEESLPKRAMVLSMGSGDIQRALQLAKQITGKTGDKDPNALAELFLAVGALHDKDYKSAAAYIKKMPENSLSDFVMPLLNAWANAGAGVYDVSKLTSNTIHLYHAVQIADFMGKKIDLLPLLQKAEAAPDLTVEDLERIGNLYAHIGEKDKAMQDYQKILDQWPEQPTATQKLQALKAGEKVETLIPIKSAENGMASTLFDMANLLYREYADDSAQVFAQMALYLEPSAIEARLLIAAIDARNDRFEDAIASYKMVPVDSDFYKEARHRAADLMEDSGHADQALTELNLLAKDHLDSLIKVGDIYRRELNFKKAVEVYNQVAQKLGGTVPKEYWNLLYVRGISYERAGEWNKAEADLKASLAYQPDHPFVLNYLAYAWADKGVHLDEALGLLRKASTAQPDDGYIADSLGWVLYRMARYDESLPQLERAVELLPYDAVVNDHLGDAYWQAGRKREAHFQWQRAGNFSKDKEQIAKIGDKLANGLPVKAMVKEARTAIAPDTGAATAIP